MEGITYPPLGFVVEVGESHRGKSKDECTSQMEWNCISKARVKRDFSPYSSLSDSRRHCERRSKARLGVLGSSPCHATNNLRNPWFFCLSSLISRMARLPRWSLISFLALELCASMWWLTKIIKKGARLGEKSNKFYFGKAEFEFLWYILCQWQELLESGSLVLGWNWEWRFGSLSITGN